MSLSKREASILENEQRIQLEPKASDAHDRLLSNYVHYKMETGRHHPHHIAHIVRVIEHTPRDSLCRCPYTHIDKKTFPDEYQRAESVWAKHLDDNPEDLLIIRGAAYFYLQSDHDKTIKILRAAAKPRRSHAEIWLDLGTSSFKPSERLHYLEEAARQGAEQPNLLVWTASAACGAGEFAKAEVLGNQLLTLARDALQKHGSSIELPYDQDSREYAAAKFTDAKEAQAFRHAMHTYAEQKHWAHSTLGLVAASRLQWTLAADHLEQSAQVNGSYRLSSYGPCFDLATALCREAHWHQVEAYLVDCSRFRHNSITEKWVALVGQKTAPEFSERHLTNESK